ncbi:transposase [Streptomyces pratensis]|uniref:transposase n=1 Tax=Streptomyces pratensis TaxID=1169025 RepID=UPI003AFB226A
MTPGHYGDGPQLERVLEQVVVPRSGVGRPRTRPDRVLADKAYTSRRNRRYLRRRGIPHTIPECLDQQRHRKSRGSRGGRPTGFDSERYKKRNTVERTINRLKGFRAVRSSRGCQVRAWPRICRASVVARSFGGTMSVALLGCGGYCACHRTFPRCRAMGVFRSGALSGVTPGRSARGCCVVLLILTRGGEPVPPLQRRQQVTGPYPGVRVSDRTPEAFLRRTFSPARVTPGAAAFA